MDAAMPALEHEARRMAGDAEGLLAALARGDPEAFRQVMEVEFDGLYILSWGILGSPDDAEDACQEVFLRLYRAASKLSANTSLRAWLRRVCVNYCLDEQRRRRRRRPTSIDELDDLPVPDPPSQQEAEQAELRRAAREAWMETIRGYSAVWIDGHCLAEHELGSNAPWDVAVTVVALREHGLLLAGRDVKSQMRWPGDDKVRRNVVAAATASVCRVLQAHGLQPGELPPLSPDGLRCAAAHPPCLLGLTGTVLGLARVVRYLRAGELVLTKRGLAAAWARRGNERYAQTCRSAAEFKALLGTPGREGGSTQVPVEVAEGFVAMAGELAKLLSSA